jgi:hypothetical protein
VHTQRHGQSVRPLRSRLTSLLVPALFLIFGFLWASNSIAAQSEVNSALLKEIQIHLAEKDYSQAIQKMEALYTLQPRAVILFNIAVAKEKLDLSCEETITAYSRFFEQCVGCRPEQIAKARLETTYDRCRYGTLSVTSQPSGMPIAIDGREVGAAPVSIRIKPGEHSVTAISPDEQLEKSVQMPPSGKVTVNLVISPKPATDLVETPGGPANRASDLSTAVSTAVPAGKSRVIEWSLIGSGLALAGTGAFLLIDANSMVIDAKSGAKNSEISKSNYDDTIDQAKPRQLHGVTLIGVGAAITIGAAAWWWFSVSNEVTPARVTSEENSLSWGIGPGVLYLGGSL